MAQSRSKKKRLKPIVDWELVKSLARKGHTPRTIQERVALGGQQLDAYCRVTYGIPFREFYHKHRNEGAAQRDRARNLDKVKRMLIILVLIGTGAVIVVYVLMAVLVSLSFMYVMAATTAPRLFPKAYRPDGKTYNRISSAGSALIPEALVKLIDTDA